MARVTVPVFRLSRYTLLTAPTPETGDATNGHVLDNDGATFFEFRNNGASDRTIEILVPQNFDSDLLIAARTYTLPASATDTKTGTFPVHLYGPQLMVDVSHSDVRILAYSVL
jgi:hypothetical protein